MTLNIEQLVTLSDLKSKCECKWLLWVCINPATRRVGPGVHITTQTCQSCSSNINQGAHAEVSQRPLCGVFFLQQTVRWHKVSTVCNVDGAVVRSFTWFWRLGTLREEQRGNVLSCFHTPRYPCPHQYFCAISSFIYDTVINIASTQCGCQPLQPPSAG